MNNKLWHFGDSFATWYNSEEPERSSKKGFSEYIADNYNLSFRHYGKGGYSNQEIYKKILENFYKFNRGDFLLINWSFFERLSYLNSDLNLQSSTILNNISSDFNFTHNEHKPYNVDYFKYFILNQSEFSVIESIKLFRHSIVPLLESLEKWGIVVINSFNSYNVSYNNNLINDTISVVEYIKSRGFVNIDSILDGRIKYINWNDSNNIHKGDYLSFIMDSDFYGEGQDVHYKFGIQEELANNWIKKINQQILKNIL